MREKLEGEDASLFEGGEVRQDYRKHGRTAFTLRVKCERDTE
jgi:hypothetical protein